MPLTPEQIAAGLTKAQRRTVLAGRLYFGRGYWPLYHSLIEKGLVQISFGHPLTPIGHQVRTILENRNDAG